MHASWTRLRRFIASAMLAAMVSFVLHGGAMAGLHQHASGAQECGWHASAKSPSHAAVATGHNHHGGEHAHGNGDAHAHLHADDVDGQKSAAAEPCCGSMCSIAISTYAPQAAWAPFSAAVELMPDDMGRPDKSPDGLKRPPRTSAIA